MPEPKRSPIPIQLTIQKVDRLCLLEMTWGQGQRASLSIDYPADLITLYDQWQTAYLKFYRSYQMRGRVMSSGVTTTSTPDHRKPLDIADQALTEAMSIWLNSQLYDLRSRILQQYKGYPLRLYLTIPDLSLARLPWETWNLNLGLAPQSIQIVRAPQNINAPPAPKRRKPRILAILGDSTGLDLGGDRTALTRLKRQAEVVFVGGQPEDTEQTLLDRITQAIVDPQGWDLLFFAGHSNETTTTGGELSLSPTVTLSIRNLAPKLRIALANGLQAAVFNSCRGLNIAEALIDLGLGQVLVMREPIHNQVAVGFLQAFLAALGDRDDIYGAMVAAQTFLTNNPQDYLATGSVASLFCHPGGQLYQLPEAKSWRSLLPNRLELAALAIAGVCTLPFFQDALLNGRTLTQALYRQTTGQQGKAAQPIALVQIDSKSIQAWNVPPNEILPFNRSRLAELVKKADGAKVVGLDFLFGDRTTAKNDLDLAQAVGKNVVVGSSIGSGKLVGPNPALGLQARQGYLEVETPPLRVEMPPRNCTLNCPIAYQLAGRKPPALPFFAGNPIVDFSIAPDQIYQRISASDFRAEMGRDRIVLIAVGDDDYRLGWEPGKPDRVPASPAFHYLTEGRGTLTGGEVLAYMTHHFAQGHFVWPIAELWLVGIAVLAGKAISVSERRSRWWLGLPGIYGLFGLQLYIAGFLLPWLLPSGVFLAYVFPYIRKK
jgi:CHASE2 domain/CHAT domain